MKSNAVAGNGFTRVLRLKAHSSQKGLGLGVLMPLCPEPGRTADLCIGVLSRSPGCLDSAPCAGEQSEGSEGFTEGGVEAGGDSARTSDARLLGGAGSFPRGERAGILEKAQAQGFLQGVFPGALCSPRLPHTSDEVRMPCVSLSLIAPTPHIGQPGEGHLQVSTQGKFSRGKSA